MTLAVLDTVRPGTEHGRIAGDQLEWLEDVASASSDAGARVRSPPPVGPELDERSEHYFGINPDDSEALCGVITRCESIARLLRRATRTATACGTSTRRAACRSSRLHASRIIPGAWAEYRIHEGGYTQLVRRISTPAAMAWTEQTRSMFAGLYRDYALGAQSDRCFTQLW